jgi:hypothetical protein
MEKFRVAGKPIVAFGINFDTQKRCVADWKIG